MRHGNDRLQGDPRGVVGALDIGSSKVCCLIAAVDSDDPRGSDGVPSPIQILGFAQGRSHGIKSGVVIDLAAAQHVVRGVVARAEQMAGTRLAEVHVAVNCGRPKSFTFAGHVAVADGVVGRRDVEALASGAEEFARRDGRVLLGLNRIGFRLDGVATSGPPIGLVGQRLDADHHAVTFDDGPLRNISLLVESCHLEIARMVPAGYASALGATTEEERRLGVTCIDIGAGVTAMATFVDGHLLFQDLVPFGGQHLTLDIARALGTPLAEAERIKALFGTLVLTASDEHQLVSCLIASEDAHGSSRHRTTKAELGRIVRHRMQGLAGLVQGRMASSAVGRLPIRRVVLCGGGSRLLGLSDFVSGLQFADPRHVDAQSGARVDGAARQLVRLAYPPLVTGLVDDQSSPAFACVAGLAIAARVPRTAMNTRQPAGRRGYFGRMERWLQDSF